MTDNLSNLNILRVDKSRLLVIEGRPVIAPKVSDKYSTLLADNHKDAIEAIKTPFPAAILISLASNRKAMLALCEFLKKSPISRNIPLILLFPDITEADEVVGFKAGAAEVLPLNVSEELLNLKVSKTIEICSQVVRPSPFLQKVDQTVLMNIEFENFGVIELAKMLHMDRKTLFLKVKRETGLPPQDYIKILRLSRAKLLLREGGVQVADVAFKVGYNDLSYFSKCFKECFGILPSRYTRKFRLKKTTN